ncbi:hypothetical protein GCM10028791_26350 [Echinicola sediminis]
MNKTAIIQNLESLIELIEQLSDDEYKTRLAILDENSIGEHVRHVIESFELLLKSYPSGRLNYEAKERNLKTQTEREFAVSLLKSIKSNTQLPDKPLELKSAAELSSQPLTSSFYRELEYNFDHSIHHQALIKIGLKELDKSHLVDKSFGLSPSTIKYKFNVHC